ncbi:uncharacterized protein EKO05_0009475 [Ascochyta rabiei]|uniref:Large ribosomal subunit protein mL49 n=1 Tax=Didymella rabiei TaxID=5454 RepID=A0A163GUA8_DIDRA|nr:uncharacterized protein EKO05_0009475 [Ascochyta rabiei]KZM25018.1 structural constituent of ribosome [Ascochyta rabiei]UPX19206.1 hypothetical protein EKO05_0009475 [Ascochyta rabiei]
MARIQRPLSLFRACTAPRPATHRAALHYTTTARAQTQTQTQPPASRAADLAAAEAITESDSAQPAAADPLRPSHPSISNSKSKNLKTAARASKTVPFTPATQPQLPLAPPRYHVARSANKNLPIYTDYKRGGNLHLTTVRKITGDLHALRDELQAWLAKKEDHVKVNSLTGHVVVKGHHTSSIAEFLKARGM